MKSAAYVRYSTDRQEDSEATQRSVIAEWCEKQGIDAPGVWYVDAAQSGGSVEGRAQLMALLTDAERELFEQVLFFKFDRAFRNLEEQIWALGRLERFAVTYRGVLDPPVDGTSGRLISNILGAVNQFERELIGERVYHHNRTLAKQGRWPGGRVPCYGYAYDAASKILTPDTARAPVVAQIFAWYLQCRSAVEVARRLQRAGERTLSGGPWTVDRVLDVLRNPIYAGKIAWGRRRPVAGKRWARRSEEYEVYDGQHESIVDEATWAAAQAIRDANRVQGRKPASAKPLSGLVRCGLCGGRGVVRNSHDGCHYYACATRRLQPLACPGWVRSGRRLDALVSGLVERNIERTGLDGFLAEAALAVDLPATAEGAGIDRRMAELDERERRQWDAYEAGVIDLDRLREVRDRVNAERQALRDAPDVQRALALSPETVRALMAWPEAWAKATNPERNRLVSSVVEDVTVDGYEVRVRFVDLPMDGWEAEGRGMLRSGPGGV